MKINEIIVEAVVTPYQSDETNLAKAVALFKGNCSESLALINSPIWRGMTNHTQNFLVIDPSTGVRQSENTTNHYTEIIDNSPYMVGWPKRSKSLICSSDPSTADSYGHLYAIFPFNGVKIAVCPGSDMWHTPIDLEDRFPDYTGWGQLSSLNSYLERKLMLPGSYQQMVDKVTNDEHWRVEVLSQHTNMPPEELLPYLQKKLSPEVAGFRLMGIREFAAANTFTECWISGPVLAVAEDYLDPLRDAIKGLK